jgi:hypothetical protein
LPKKNKSRRTLKVVFDTNVLFTEHASELVRLQIKDLITKNKGDADLAIEWYLPELVIGERRYQMRQVACEFLPHVRKLERLLGVGLNITEQVLNMRVDEAIERSTKELGFQSLSLDYSGVDLRALAEASVNRVPPFADGGRGFRDALIAQTFTQLIRSSPKSGTLCRLVLLTADGPLTECVNALVGDNSNVSVLEDIAELESLINTLVSTVTEEYVKHLSPKAHELFYEKDNSNTVWYGGEIWKRTNEKYTKELLSVPAPEYQRKNGTWQLAYPGFSKKIRQRVYWITGIAVPFELLKSTTKEDVFRSALITRLLTASTGTATTPTSAATGAKSGTTLNSLLGIEPPKHLSFSARELAGVTSEPIKAGTGTTRFEVEWSASVRADKKLSRPKVEDIRLVGTTFEVA